MAETVLISGAGRGLGLCLTEIYLERGSEVHVIVRTLTDKIKSLQKKYENYYVHIGDVSEEALLSRAAGEILEQVDRLDYLYHTAGIFWENDRKGLLEQNIDEMAEMMNVNACGALRVLKSLDSLINSETRIIVVSSESGSLTNCQDKGQYSYNMSKAALNMGIRIYHNEHGNQGNIILVDPGWMRTDMGGQNAHLDPRFSAEQIILLAEGMDKRDKESLFYKYDGRALPW